MEYIDVAPVIENETVENLIAVAEACVWWKDYRKQGDCFSLWNTQTDVIFRFYRHRAIEDRLSRTFTNKLVRQ